MLITFIVTTAVLAVLYLIINICNKIIDKPVYDFSTGSLKSLLIFAHTAFGVTFFVIASEIILYYFWTNETALWCIYSVFLFIAVIELLLLYGLYFTYEAIRGDEVYVHRYFRIKKIKVNDIRNNRLIGRSMIGFYDKKNKCLFLVDSITPGIQELIRLIDERKYNVLNEESQEDTYTEERAILTQLGQEYRAGYNKRRKRLLIAFPIVGAAVIIAFVLIFYFIGTDTYTLVLMGLLGAIGIAVNLFAFLTSMNRDMSLDDESLGSKYKFTNKRVKGASKNKFKQLIIVCVSFMFLGAVLTIGLWGFSNWARNYDELTPITGKIEYIREQRGRSAYIAIGLDGVPTEYRLSEICADEFDYSFLDEVKVGDTVTVLIDSSKAREFSLRGVSKKQWNYFYYLATDYKEYFTYEDYVKGHERNDRIGYITAYVGIAMLVASTVTIIIGYFVCKKLEKGEYIEIYK